MKLNWKYAFLSLTLLLIEIIIALFVRDAFVRPYVGDVLVVVLLYCVVRTFIRKEIKLLPVYIFIFASFVEVLQFFNVASLLHLDMVPALRVIVGATFDWTDILFYFIGAMAAGLMQWLDHRNGKLLIPAFFITTAVFALIFFILECI